MCKYDAAIRKRAVVKGVETFGIIHHVHNEMFTYFTYDNTVKAASPQTCEGKSAKFKSSTKMYSDIVCNRFNS